MARKSHKRRRHSLGAASSFKAAAKACKGRPQAAFRSCMRSHLKK